MIVIYVLAGVGALCVACSTVILLLLVRDQHRVRRARGVRGGKPLTARQRRALDRLDPDRKNGKP